VDRRLGFRRKKWHVLFGFFLSFLFLSIFFQKKKKKKKPGVYGTQGVGTTSTKPGSRSGAVVAEINENLWLFGGLGLGNISSSSVLNDLWAYNMSTGIWTWVHGSANIASPGT
jgi:hypothetical protein